MHDRSPIEFHQEVIYSRKQESKLKKLPLSARQMPEQDALIESLRDYAERLLASSELHKP